MRQSDLYQVINLSIKVKKIRKKIKNFVNISKSVKKGTLNPICFPVSFPKNKNLKGVSTRFFLSHKGQCLQEGLSLQKGTSLLQAQVQSGV